MAGKSAKTMKERFWQKVKKGDGCWIWTGATKDSGYGAFAIQGQTRNAHAVAYELVHGNVPPGKVIRHKCDNKLCVNPSHLEVGTYRENALDHFTRHKAKQAKITFKNAQEIRRYHTAGFTVESLAREYGISTTQINNIIQYRTWKLEDFGGKKR